MDDSLEYPSAAPFANAPGQQPGEEDENSSGDEDGGLDWSTLSFGGARPVIPKRGEKEFEPASEGGSGLQLHVLDRARRAMFNALRATRGTSSKSISYGIWRPEIARVQVTLARGMHFSAMGHSAPMPLSIESQTGKLQKMLALLPEEAIYLIERGALFCRKEIRRSAVGMEDVEGSPMSVQQSYSEMIGTENLTLEKYQVFAYLRRLGYVVTRTEPPTSSYPIPQPLLTSPDESYIRRIVSGFPSWISRFFRLFTRSFDWWRPLRFSHWLHHDRNYAFIFKSLRFIPTGHGIPLLSQKPTSSPYKIFFNLYKPSTPFRKSAPPPPDFSVVVVNARTTPMPALSELDALFDILPELPPPLPRQKHQVIDESPPERYMFNSILLSATQACCRRLFPCVFSPRAREVRKPNPFVALKSGKKNVVIAAVDTGSISFFRFNQGAFSEWPMT